jgi:hypothetical protein
MWQIKKRVVAAVIRSELRAAFNSTKQTLLIAVCLGACVVYLTALKRRRALTICSKKIGTDHPGDSAEQNVSEAPGADTIAALAHQIWQNRGCPYGTDKEDWFRAEQELKRTKSIATS